MPGSGKRPAGGYKVVYEYANRLAKDGYDVSVVYASSIFFRTSPLIEKIKSIFRYIYYYICGYKCNNWFDLNQNINQILVPSLSQKYVKPSDIYIATAVQTVIYLKEYKVDYKNKIYLIQDFENWFITDKEVYETYNYGFKNVAISQWLYDKVIANGASCYLIKNGFDFNYFKLNNSIASRNRYSISMLYHKDKRKGCKYGIEALNKLKIKYPEISVTLFGVPKRPNFLPGWIKYCQQPNKEELNNIYNKSSIYLAPSITEGWGLTVGEAMICGAAIVCTDTLGFKEMVVDNESGLICPIRDATALAKSMEYLIEHDETRIKLAEKGKCDIHKFDWNESYLKVVELLK